MDILKRSLAPITDEGWEEIEDQAREILETQLTGRKFVDVKQPQGWDYSAVPEGRLSIVDDSSSNLKYGVRKVKPLLEIRLSFELNRWELDNLDRGAKDVDLSPLEDAVEKAANFENEVIYNGLEKAGIEGLIPTSELTVSLGDGPDEVLEALAESKATFSDQSIEGPYTLIADENLWKQLVSSSEGYPLTKRVNDLLKGTILYSPGVEEPMVVSTRGEDFELTLGQDFSIGYESHDSKSVKLFLTESFTFQIIDPAAAIKLAR